MRTLIICHAEAPLERDGLARWLGSFSDYAGTIAIREPRSRSRRRVAREIARVGWGRFLDVIAFRAYYRFACAARDRAWEREVLDRVRARCKTLLAEQTFSIPRLGTFVIHPGICPEYRNAHGCFWALANGEPEN